MAACGSFGILPGRVDQGTPIDRSIGMVALVAGVAWVIVAFKGKVERSHTPKLDSAAASWAAQLARTKADGAGFFIVCLSCAIAWGVLSALTEKVGYVVAAIVWAFVALLQFERRGFLLLVRSNTHVAPKKNA